MHNVHKIIWHQAATEIYIQQQWLMESLMNSWHTTVGKIEAEDIQLWFEFGLTAESLRQRLVLVAGVLDVRLDHKPSCAGQK